MWSKWLLNDSFSSWTCVLKYWHLQVPQSTRVRGHIQRRWFKQESLPSMWWTPLLEDKRSLYFQLLVFLTMKLRHKFVGKLGLCRDWRRRKIYWRLGHCSISYNKSTMSLNQGDSVSLWSWKHIFTCDCRYVWACSNYGILEKILKLIQILIVTYLQLNLYILNHVVKSWRSRWLSLKIIAYIMSGGTWRG